MNTRTKTIRYSMLGISAASFLGVFGYVAATDHTKPAVANTATTTTQVQQPPAASDAGSLDSPVYGRREHRYRTPDDGYSGSTTPVQPQTPSTRQTVPSAPSTQQSAPSTHTRSRAS